MEQIIDGDQPSSPEETLPANLEPVVQEPAAVNAQPCPPEPGSHSLNPDRVSLLIVGLLLAVLAMFVRSQSYTAPLGAMPLIIMALGIAAFLLGLREDQGNREQSRLLGLLAWIEKKVQFSPIQCTALIVGLGCIAVSISNAGDGPSMKSAVLGIGGWIAAIGLTFASGWQPGRRFSKPSWKQIAWLSALFLPALLLRAIDTGHIPMQLTGDEASAGLAAAGLLKGTWNNILGLSWFSFPALFFTIPAGSIFLLGQTTEALRLPSALAGALTVIGVYWLGRELFDHRAGLYGAVLLAALHFHIHFSRIGLNNIWDGFFFAVVPAAFWRAWKSGRRLPFLAAGFLLGLSQYFYVTTRVLPILVILWILILGLKDRATFKRNLPNLMLMAWMGLVVFAPLGSVFIQQPDNFLAPMSRVSLEASFQSSELTSVWTFYLGVLSRIMDGFRGFIDLPTRFWYVTGEPVLRLPMAAFFILGLSFLFYRWKDGRSWILISLVATIAVAGGLSESTPAAQRYVAGAPIATLIAGFCLALIVARLQKAWPQRQRWFYGAALVVIAMMAASDINFYFNNYTPTSMLTDVNTHTAQHLADYLKEKSGDWQVIFYGDPAMGYDSIASLPYLVPNIKGDSAHRAWGDPANPLPSSSNVIFVFLKDHEADLTAAEAQYPGGRLIDYYDPILARLYWIYEFSPFPR